MKKISIPAVSILISISPLFKGLFFPYETYIFFTAIMCFTTMYCIHKVMKNEPFYLQSWFVFPAALLPVAYLMSFTQSVSPRANVDSILQYTAVFLVFTVLFDYFKNNKSHIPAMVFLPLIGSGLIAGILGMAGYTKAFPQLLDTVNGDRIGSTLQYANTAAVYFLILIALAVSIIITSRSIIIKAVLAGISSTLFMALFFTGSRGVYVIVPFLVFVLLIFSMPAGARLKCAGYLLCIALPMLISMKGFYANSKITNWISASKWVILSFAISSAAAFILSMILKLKLSLKVKYSVLSAFAAVISVFYYINRTVFNAAVSAFAAESIPKSIINRIYDINLTTHSVTIRIDFYKDALKLIRQHWLLGLGGGGFAALYQSVQDFFYTARLVHNHYLQVFVEAGILGFLAFTLLVLVSCVYYILAAFRTKDWKDRVYISGSFCAFAALAAHSAIDFNLSYSSMLLIFWSLMAVGAAYYRNAKSETAVKTNIEKLDQVEIENSVQEKTENSSREKSRLVPAVLAAVSLLVMAVSGYYMISSHYTRLADEYRDQYNTEKAIEFYEKAAGMDAINPVLHAELAERYRWMAYCSKTGEDRLHWIGKAVQSGEAAVRYSPYYPYYRQIMTLAYFEADQPVKAWEQTETLVRLQPKKMINFDHLARGRLEAGLALIKENRVEEAGKLLRECVDISNYPGIKINSTLAFYIGKANLVAGNFEQAEKLLTTARGGSLELKMNSDRLLYIINEETGRVSKNEAYKGVPWMGMVRLTPEYREIKQILSSKVLDS